MILGLAEVGHRAQRIDGTRVRRTRIATDRDRREAGRAVFSNHGSKRIHIESVPIVTRHLPHPFGPDPDDRGGTTERRVTLVGHVHRGAVRGTRRLACGDERIEARRGSAAREQPAAGLGIAEPVAKPVDHDDFQLAGAGCSEPRALKDVVPGCHVVRQDAWPRR